MIKCVVPLLGLELEVRGRHLSRSTAFSLSDTIFEFRPSTTRANMATQLPIPEQYKLLPTRHCPNSVLPVLVYRNVLPEPRTEESVSTWLQRHGGWVKKARLGIDTGRVENLERTYQMTNENDE